MSSSNGNAKDIKELDSLLRKKLGNEVIVVNYSITNLVPFGENFRSDLLKVNVKVRRNKNSKIEELHLVAKLVPQIDFVNTNWTATFESEIYIYNTLISLYEKIEFDHGIDKTHSISNNVPKFYGHRLSLNPDKNIIDNDGVILLENLKIKGYYTMDKRIGLDVLHAIKALKTLARFHAAGIAFKSSNPIDLEEIRMKYCKPKWDNNDFLKLLQSLFNFLCNNPHYEKYSLLLKNMFERLKIQWESDPVTTDVWSTIIHSDYWVNNIMFHSDSEGNIDNVKIIDFQTYTFGDIFNDLTYFLFTSLNDDAKLIHMDELIGEYYHSLISALEQLNVDVKCYSKEKFDQHFKEVARNEFYHCALALHFITNKLDGQQDSLMDLLKFGGNDLFVEKLNHMFSIFEKNDWFY